MTRVQTTERFPQDIHNSQNPSRSLRQNLAFPELPSISKMIPTQSRIPPFWEIYLSEAFTTLKSSPPHDLLYFLDPLRSEGFSSEPEAPTTEYP